MTERGTLTTVLIVALGSVVIMGPLAAAAESDPDKRSKQIRASYAKFEYRIPMRDGIRLFTSVYIPNNRSETYPILLVRTPYTVAPYGLDRYRKFSGPQRQIRRGRIHFRLSGCPWPLHVGR